MGRKRYTRIRKRFFVVTGLILLAVLLVSGIIVLFASYLAGPEDLVRLNISEGQGRMAVLGSGISLEQADTANLVQDASFEPLVFRQSLTIYNGDATTLTVSSEDASAGQYGDGFFDGSTARVMTQTSAGLTLKKAARVLHYGINRVGVFQKVNLPGDMPSNQAVLAFVRNGDLSLAAGEKGLIIRNVTGQMPEVAESGVTADLTGICQISGGFLACSSSGDLLSSADGQTWELWPVFSPATLRAVAASTDQDLYVAVGDQGTIIAGHAGTGSVVSSFSTKNLTDVAYGSSTYIVIGEKGTILTSQTGLLWQSVELPGEIDWRTVDYRDGRFVLAGSGGAVAISDNGRDFQLLEHDTQTEYVDVVMLSRQQLIALDREGSFFISNDGGASWLQSVIDTGMKSRVIALAGKDKILSADASGKIGLAQLVAEIQLDSPLKEGQYLAGDMIFLEKTATSVPETYLAADITQASFQDPWQLFGPGSRQRVTDEVAPGGGVASMKLQAAASTGDASAPTAQTEATILSQVLSPDLLAWQDAHEVYQVELWMKQTDIKDRSVQAWLTGPFQTAGTTFTNVGSSWKKYSFTFVMPVIAGNMNHQEIRLNISIGSGTLWLDQINLCRAKDTTTELDADFQDEIKAINPQVIRLGFARIGSPTTRQESWASSLGNDNPYLSTNGWTSQTGTSLQAALTMTRASGANPWLVIDSYTSESSLLNLIEFMAGPISEPYGKLRQEQGEVIPWTDRFSRILIEFTDSGGVCRSEQMKAGFVNLMIDTISQSPYYRQIKSKLIFVDGMTYSDGVMLSTADYHASDFAGLIQADHKQALDDAFLHYYDSIPRNPEKTIQNWPELMRTARMRSNGTEVPDLADLTEILLRDLGIQTGLSNLSLPVRSSSDWQPVLPVAAGIASGCAQGIPLTITGGTDEIRCYGYQTADRIAIAIVNLSDKPASCQFVTDLSLQHAKINKYDAKGNLVGRQTLKSSNSRQTVLAGGAVLVVRENSD